MSRLTAIYDLDHQPFSMGDMLVFLQGALVEQSRLGLDNIHVVISYNTESPTREPKLAHINARNVREHMLWLESTAAMCSQVKTVTIEARKNKKGRQEEPVWPPGPPHYITYNCLGTIADTVIKRGSFPRLTPRDDLRQWASAFLEKYGQITVNLRKTATNPSRDSDLRVWLEFFKKSRERFVIVCAPHEVIPEMRLGNLTFAKDYGSSAAQDCALVEGSRFHIGVSSGPTMLRWFSGRPLCEFRAERHVLERFPGAFENGGRWRFTFASQWQSAVFSKENVANIETELERMKQCAPEPA